MEIAGDRPPRYEKKRGIAGRRALLVSPTGRYWAHLCSSSSPEPEQVRIAWQMPELQTILPYRGDVLCQQNAWRMLSLAR